MSDVAPVCPFCAIDETRIVIAGTCASALWDAFPLNPGHVLVVPHRHVGSWFDTSAEERDEIVRIVDEARLIVMARFAPQGFNLGVNDGVAAGQTVPHLHVHLIPRYAGDVPDPRGGVRCVIPHRARYWNRG